MNARILADPGRTDGRNADGIPGDCLRVCLAVLLHLPYEQVPHAALYGPSWWDVLRRWARGRGGDLADVPLHGGRIDYAFPHGPPARLIAYGPSPRARLASHAVVVDADLNLIHDPHPSGVGLTRIDDVIVWCDPYDDPPIAPMHALCAASTLTTAR